jgi:hypothetical protein
MAEANFSIADELKSVKNVLDSDLKKTHAKFTIILD